MKTVIVIFLICLFWSHNALSANEPDYLDMIDKALYVEYAEVKMEVYKNDKLEKFYKMQFFRQQIKIRMEFLEPAVEKGRRMLNDETNMWMYLPRTSKVMKLPLKQPFMGSDASNRDLMRIAFKKDYDLTNVKTVDDTTALLELKAKDLSISYNKVVILFDTKRRLPLNQDMYSLSGKLIKTIIYEYKQSEDGSWHTYLMTLKDELLKDSLTKMYYENVKHSNKKASVFFTLGSLKQ